MGYDPNNPSVNDEKYWKTWKSGKTQGKLTHSGKSWKTQGK